MDVPGIGRVKGDWDLRGRFDDYIGHVDLAGKSVLDVGTASGFLTFEAEKRGAIVTSFDADRFDRFQTMPPGKYDPDYFRCMRNGFDLAYEAFGSHAARVYGDIYAMSELVGRFDVVIVGQILVNLRDPFGALEQAARACRDTLIIAEGMFDAGGDRPLAVYCGTEQPYAWWQFSPMIYRHVLACYGFTVASESVGTYKSRHTWGGTDITTIVARRAGR